MTVCATHQHDDMANQVHAWQNNAHYKRRRVLYTLSLSTCKDLVSTYLVGTIVEMRRT